MNEHDVSGARAVVRYLGMAGLNWYRNGAKRRAWETTYAAIGGHFRTCQSEEELTGALPRYGESGSIGDGTGQTRHILLAPPGNKPVVCLLGARWDLSAQPVQMSLYLHLFGQSALSNTSTWHRGYRLELGHRSGVHAYTHVQPIRANVWPQSKPIPFADQGVPDNFPALPVRGNHLTTLCAALAVALDATALQHVVFALNGHRMQRYVQDLLSHDCPPAR